MSGLDDLYQEVVMDHGASPRNMRRVDGAQRSAHGFNPFCGDIVDVEIRIDGETISDVGFTGKGCAISRASASLMTEAVKGRSEHEARAVFEAFHAMITGAGNGAGEPGADPDADADEDLLGDAGVLSGVAAYPTRIKCALLGWRTVIAALDDADADQQREAQTVSTE